MSSSVREHIPSLTEGDVCESRPTPVDPHWLGIDRLSFSFPVSQAARDGWTTQQRQAQDDGGEMHTSSVTVEREDGAYAIFVGVMERIDPDGVVRRFGKVEGNPSRFLDPSGCTLAPVDGFDDYTREMWDVATSWLDPSCLLSEARLKRVDLARDFRGVSIPSAYVRGLVGVSRPYAKRSSVHSDPARGSAETLTVGSGAGTIRLYDQYEAYAEKGAPEGALRWEITARTGWLARIEAQAVGDWSPAGAAELAADRWDWSKCGYTVGSRDVLLARIGTDERISAPKRERLLGRLLLQSQGLPTGGGRRTAYDYDRLQEEYGIAMLGDENLKGFSGRLDLETGTEVLS